MRKCILPFTLDVEMRTYHSTAFPLGIMKANFIDYENWLCNKMILVQSTHNDVDNQFECVEDDWWSIIDGALFKQNLQLAPQNYRTKGIDVISLNKEMLQKGNYISGLYNEYYIPGKEPFGKYDFNHDYIIYGFDDFQEVFKSAGYMADGNYQFFDIEYKNYENAIAENKVSLAELMFSKVDPLYKIEVDITTIKKKLMNYIYSYCDAQLYNQKADGYFYGLSAWDMLSDYVRYNKETSLDLRYGRLFMEHKNVMYKRLVKLFELSYINNCERLIDDYYTDVYRRATITFNLFMKYNLTNQEKIKNRITSNIVRINELERELLTELVARL